MSSLRLAPESPLSALRWYVKQTALTARHRANSVKAAVTLQWIDLQRHHSQRIVIAALVSDMTVRAALHDIVHPHRRCYPVRDLKRESHLASVNATGRLRQAMAQSLVSLQAKKTHPELNQHHLVS